MDRHIVVSLRELGLDVTYISEDCPGIDDPRVLELAVLEGRALLTEDKDFWDLVFRTNLPTHGVLLIRLSDMTPQEAADLVCKIIERHGQDLVGHFAVLNSKALRIRGAEI